MVCALFNLYFNENLKAFEFYSNYFYNIISMYIFRMVVTLFKSLFFNEHKFEFVFFNYSKNQRFLIGKIHN